MTVAVLVAFAVAFAVTAVLIALSERQERRAARSKLLLAQAAFERGELTRTLQLLDGAFYVPASSRYAAQDAAIALEAMRLLVRVLSQQGAEVKRLMEPLTQALERATDAGGEVPDALTQPVKRLLQSEWSAPMTLALAGGRA